MFKKIIDLAKKVRDETIEADAEQMAADAAAVASFWSFGMGMAAFATLEATQLALKADISKKSKELNEKMTTADADIAKKIDKNVYKYVELYKTNNTIIQAQDPKGMGLREARANLMQFMSEVDTHYADKGGLTVSNFVQLAASAKIAFNSQEINDVYDALDSLNMSNKAEGDVQKFTDTLKGLKIKDHGAIFIIHGASLGFALNRLGVAKDTLQRCAEASELPLEEIDNSAFGMMDAYGKFAAGVAIILSVVDVILKILDIKSIVEQSKKMVDELNQKIKPDYKEFFRGIRDAAKAYNDAISGN